MDGRDPGVTWTGGIQVGPSSALSQMQEQGELDGKRRSQDLTWSPYEEYLHGRQQLNLLYRKHQTLRGFLPAEGASGPSPTRRSYAAVLRSGPTLLPSLSRVLYKDAIWRCQSPGDTEARVTTLLP